MTLEKSTVTTKKSIEQDFTWIFVAFGRIFVVVGALFVDTFFLSEICGASETIPAQRQPGQAGNGCRHLHKSVRPPPVHMWAPVRPRQ